MAKIFLNLIKTINPQSKKLKESQNKKHKLQKKKKNYVKAHHKQIN